MISRQELAEIAVKYKHKPVFTPNSNYYKGKKEGHVYGGFQDVPVDHPYFNYIETAVLSGYIQCENEKFYPEKQVTRDELAHMIFMLFDIKDKPNSLEIKDIKNCKNAGIIQMLCNNNIMSLDEHSNFRPESHVSGNDILEYLARAERLYN